MTPGQLLLEAKGRLDASGCPDAKTDAWYLYEYVFRADRAQFLLHQVESFTPEADEKIAAFRQLVNRRSTGEPLQYITGETWFMGLRFEVNPSVLVPRADTETLAEMALEQLREGESVLDMCTFRLHSAFHSKAGKARKDCRRGYFRRGAGDCAKERRASESSCGRVYTKQFI